MIFFLLDWLSKLQENSEQKITTFIVEMCVLSDAFGVRCLLKGNIAFGLGALDNIKQTKLYKYP